MSGEMREGLWQTCMSGTTLRGEMVGGRLSTGLGVLEICGAGTQSGCATYAIRPEHMRLGCAPGPNALPARVLAQTFHGEQSEYQLQVGDKMIRVRAFQPVAPPAVGEVYVELPPEHLFPVCDDEAAPERHV